MDSLPELEKLWLTFSISAQAAHSEDISSDVQHGSNHQESISDNIPKHSARDSNLPTASISVPLSDEEFPVNELIKTQPITEELLLNKVRTIYANLVPVERKCVELDHQLANNLHPLSNEQWQAVLALHQTLLQKHHSFFLASQHAVASPSLRKLAHHHAMPARMWRHGIHVLLDVLHFRISDSLDHLLDFIDISYSMMLRFLESVPNLENIWIECLGDLARYRMAVEEFDFRVRAAWANVARQWYNKAADKSPQEGRLQHHLAVLSKSNILQQLFLYSKSLICVQPFPKTKESMLRLFTPILDPQKTTHYSPVMLSIVKAHGTLYTRQSMLSFLKYGLDFIGYLGTQIRCIGAEWREQGVFIACTNIGALFEHDSDSLLIIRRALFML
ncbi:hypothetical protein LOZ65_006863 [Ophidiomyces ophidiicola]|nr:hypothetical protein LOZ65_006863 [Ophidiomyces ophidiicola]